MKKTAKILTVILAVAVMTATLATMSNAFSDVSADVVYGTPKAIDGKYDSGWKNAVKVSNTFGNVNQEAANYHAQQGWLEVTQVSADMRAMWDENCLYLLFDVKDPTVGTAEEGNFQEAPADALGGNLWQRNTIQLFIDWGDEGHNSGKDKGYDGNDCKVQLNSRGATDYFYGTWFKDCATFATEVTETGYTMEIAIEYSKFASTYNFEPGEGKTMGLGFIVCDSDAWFTWHRDSWCGWGGSDLLQDWPNEMGNLVFKARTADSGSSGGQSEPSADTADYGVAAIIATAVAAAAVVIISKKRR